MNTKKQPARKSGKSRVPNPITLRKNELRIKYSNVNDLLHHLNTATQYVSSKATQHLMAYEAGSDVRGTALDQLSLDGIPDLLGPEAANTIVTGCAKGEQDPSTKLGDIQGLDLLGFQTCVQKGIIGRGYQPGPIPASTSTTLGTVMSAIQGCSK
jgi:hypothetical protein